MLNTSPSLICDRFTLGDAIATTELNMLFHACDTLSQERVVIKMSRRGICANGKHTTSCTSLAREANILRRLRHARLSVPRPITHCHWSGQAYLTLSFVPGATLEALHEQRRLSARVALDVVLAACDIVAAAHALGYVHNDVKPANIMRRGDGRVVLIDWGAVQPLRATGTPSHQLLTIAYASPEQRHGAIAIGNDVYALGKTLLELIPQPSERLLAVIGKATAPAPQRYEHVEELRGALARIRLVDQLAHPLGLSALGQ